MRTFVAILLPEDLRARLADEVSRLRAAARSVAWVGPDNLHLTLKFLGYVDAERLARVTTIVAEIAASVRPFELALRSLGAFPTPTRPRVVWAGVDAGASDTAALAGRIDAMLSPLGFPTEARPFAGHVTLGRVREPRRDAKLAAAIASGAGRGFGTFRVDSVALMRSDLSPKGARYTPIASWALAAAGSATVHSLQGETGS